METAKCLMLLVLYLTIAQSSSQDTCPVVRYTGSFKERDHVKDHALLGRSYKNLTTNTVQECFSICINDCRCVSYQLSGTQCELIDEDRHTALDRFKPMPGYKYYELRQKFKKSTSDECSSQCSNGCCQYSQSCLNGGTCIELCQKVTHKFQCKCPQDFGGRVCEIHSLCAAYSKKPVASIYPIQTNNGKPLKVYCDMTSEPGMVWTLIESFALAMKDKYQNKGFVKDSPFNVDSFNWADYRLSRSAMEHVKSHATHWRATCNYDTDGLNKTDYIRGLLSNMDILTYVGDPTCVRLEYINVRGISCQNCTTHFRQSVNIHPVVNSFKLRGKCQLNFRNGAIQNGTKWCDNFGRYGLANPAHRCSASSTSTTQWWLGELV